MIKLLILVVLLLAVPVARAQESFRLPDNPRGIIIDYLERMNIKDASRALSEVEKHELCRFFVKAHTIAIRREKQSFFLHTTAPIYGLLVTNFPAIRERESEGGALINTGEIVNFFNSLPDYRPDVIQVLRKGMDGRYCRTL